MLTKKKTLRARCSGAWCQGQRLREPCGWSAELTEPPVHGLRGHQPRPGQNRFTSCPSCGGSVAFYRRSRIKAALQFIREEIDASSEALRKAEIANSRNRDL